jgi:cytochrome c556
MPVARAHRFVAPALLICTILGSAAQAQEQLTRAEQLLKYRKAVYQTMVWNVGPLGAMAQDKIPFNAAEFALRAGRVAALTPMLAESYSPESRGVAGSRLKAEMWQNRADFDAKLRTSWTAARRLRRSPRRVTQRPRRRVLRHGKRLQGLPRQIPGGLTQNRAIVASGAARSAIANAIASAATIATASTTRELPIPSPSGTQPASLRPVTIARSSGLRRARAYQPTATTCTAISASSQSAFAWCSAVMR